MKTAKYKNMWRIAEIELRYSSQLKISERPKIRTSKEAHEIFRQTWDINKINLLEQFKVMLLDRAFRVRGIAEVSSGGISQTTADPRLIFATALKGAAAGIIVAHNHPSGSTNPSSADFAITKKLEEIGNCLDLTLVDHIIITNEKYLSFSDEGYLMANKKKNA